MQKSDLREFHPHPELRKHKRTLALKLNSFKGLSLLIGSTLSWRLKLRFPVITGLQEPYQPGFLQRFFTPVLQHSAIRRWLLGKDLLCTAIIHLISSENSYGRSTDCRQKEISPTKSLKERNGHEPGFAWTLAWGLFPAKGRPDICWLCHFYWGLSIALGRDNIAFVDQSVFLNFFHPIWKI